MSKQCDPAKIMYLDLFNIVFFIAFIVFAYFNFNDDDSWLWVPLYLIPSLLCGLTLFGVNLPIFYLLISIGYTAYAIRLFFVKDGVYDWIKNYNTPSIVASMQADKPYIEITREFFGLLIVVFSMLVNYFFI